VRKRTGCFQTKEICPCADGHGCCASRQRKDTKGLRAGTRLRTACAASRATIATYCFPFFPANVIGTAVRCSPAWRSTIPCRFGIERAEAVVAGGPMKTSSPAVAIGPAKAPERPVFCFPAEAFRDPQRHLPDDLSCVRVHGKQALPRRLHAGQVADGFARGILRQGRKIHESCVLIVGKMAVFPAAGSLRIHPMPGLSCELTNTHPVFKSAAAPPQFVPPVNPGKPWRFEPEFLPLETAKE